MKFDIRNLFHKKKETKEPIVVKEMPKHIAVIMDGNGRWAKKRGLPRTMGHKAGAATFKNIARYAASIGVQYFSVYAFSTENWRRPAEEVNALIDLFIQYLVEAERDFSEENMRVRFLGEIEAFPQKLQDLIHDIEARSADRDGMTLAICLNYGGRPELVSAMRKLAVQVQNGELTPDQITEDTISRHLYCPEIPDPDLIIRPSGELRLSNFLLWQSAYSEFVFMNVLWPDFTSENLEEAIDQYTGRDRRFGGV